MTIHVASHLARGRIDAEMDLPKSPRTLLRMRVPAGYRVKSGSVGGRTISADDKGTLDLSGLSGPVKLVAAVVRE